MDAFKGTLGVLVAILVVIGLSVAAWQLNWFVEGKNTDRRTSINDRSHGRQSGLREKVLRDIRTVRDLDAEQDPNNEAVATQRAAIVDSICDNADQMTDSVVFPQSAQDFINTECP
jgi:hypothetical protein